MILLLTAACVTGGLLLGRYVARRTASSSSNGDASVRANGDSGADPPVAPERGDSPDDVHRPARPTAITRRNRRSAGARGPESARDPGAVSSPGRELFAGFPCRLGDVVLRSGGGEAWLAGALVFVEDAPVAALFIAPEAKSDIALYVRAVTSGAVWWMHAVAAGEIAAFTEPPTSLEHGEARFERRRRLPLTIERAGSGAPDVGENAVLAEYSGGPYDQLLLLIGPGGLHAWRGTALEDGMYEVIPSGASTLEP